MAASGDGLEEACLRRRRDHRIAFAVQMQDAHARRGESRFVGLFESPPAGGAGQLPKRGHVEFGRHAMQFERLLVIESARAGEGLRDDVGCRPRDRDCGKQTACRNLKPEPRGQLGGSPKAAHEDDRLRWRFAAIEHATSKRQRDLPAEGEPHEDRVAMKPSARLKRACKRLGHPIHAAAWVDRLRPRGHERAAVGERGELGARRVARSPRPGSRTCEVFTRADRSGAERRRVDGDECSLPLREREARLAVVDLERLEVGHLELLRDLLEELHRRHLAEHGRASRRPSARSGRGSSRPPRCRPNRRARPACRDWRGASA